MTTPKLIVIGAQKCGTTTLYNDLKQHPHIVLSEKESSILLTEGNLSALRAKYERETHSSSKSLVEVSTEYAMRPLNNIAHIAAQVAPRAQIVYIVRDPISRVISHHHHEVSERTMTGNIDDAVRKCPRLVDYSRYAYQIRPWLDAFGKNQVHVVHFEQYMSNRQEGAARLFALANVDTHSDLIHPTVHNAASDKRVAIGLMAQLAANKFYRHTIRPKLPSQAKEGMKALLLPKAPPRPAPPTQATLRFLVDALRPEVDALSEILNEEPWWDLGDTWLT